MTNILIITANDPNDRLNMLAREGKDIQRWLNASPRKNYDVTLLPETTTEDIIKELNIPNRQVEVLHYAGHANNDVLRLADTDAGAKELATKLQSLGTLKLVFVNGCASKGQVQFFHAAGIPFVVATSRPIEDEKAFWLATQFYQYLTLGRSLREAFNEVFNDANFQKKDIVFGGERGIMPIPQTDAQDIPWGLYVRTGSENADYRLPFTAKMVSDTEGVNHTVFLDNIIYALESVSSPQFAGIKRLLDNLRRGNVPNNKKISELIKAVPYTLGLRIRQITAEPEDKSSEYYRELLYYYIFLHETLLHHTASVLIAQVWQNKQKMFANKPTSFDAIMVFWLKNRLTQSPQDYSSHIQYLLDWLTQTDVPNPFSKTDTEGLLTYLNSEAFEQAAIFFYQQKMQYEQRVRLNESESLENCFIAQQHLDGAFQGLKFVTAYVMASVRGIDVTNFRHVATEYSNIVSKLVITEAEPTSVFGKKMLENKSVLCYNTAETNFDAIMDIPEKTTLFPFVIDRNVFTEKSNNEVDLYLFMGYFDDVNGKKCYHFASVQNPRKVWQFDETQNHVSLLHIGESASFAHQANHLMADAGEFKMYLTQFKNTFLNG